MSVFFHEKLSAYFFEQYPFDLNQGKNQPKITPLALENALASVNDGGYIKIFFFSDDKFMFKGHSMLIKKMGATFPFFDPNHGEKFNMSLSDVCALIYADWGDGFSKFVLMDGKKFIESIRSKMPEDRIEVPKPTFPRSFLIFLN